MKNELNFLNLSEKLKLVLRHCWLSDGRRQESVAEHSWRLALMVLRFAYKLSKKINIEKCLKMAIVHDLPEAIVGDCPVYECQSKDKKREKFNLENAAMIEIKKLLNDENGNEIYDLWQEYESQSTYESKFVKALDKLEAFIQHNESPLSTWEEYEKEMIFQKKWLIDYCEFDPYMNELAEAVIEEAIQKMFQAGENIEKIRSKAGNLC